MGKVFLPQGHSLTPVGKLQTLVENRSIYSLSHCELNIFETYRRSERVSLSFNDLVFTTMLRGKKVMHLFGDRRFDYLPGESVVLPGNEEMIIDFPEASMQNPSQCIALSIDNSKIAETLNLFNERMPKAEASDEWALDPEQFHIKNTVEITGTIDRLVNITKENTTVKDLYANLAVQELLLRLMQTQARHIIFDNASHNSTSNRFAFVVQYIRQNLDESLTIDKLSNMACMSKPHFFRSFKTELGISPVEFIIQERIKTAKKLLLDPLVNISDACFRTGFQSVSYFSTLFKKYVGVSPKVFKKSIGSGSITK